MSQKDKIEKLIKSYDRRLQKLEQQAAVSGITVDPKVLIEIEDIEEKIKGLQADLDTLEDDGDNDPIVQVQIFVENDFSQLSADKLELFVKTLTDLMQISLENMEFRGHLGSIDLLIPANAVNLLQAALHTNNEQFHLLKIERVILKKIGEETEEWINKGGRFELLYDQESESKIRKVTLDSLIRQLPVDNYRHPDYMMWLGAGASVSSEIPTASGIVIDLLRRVYAQRMTLTLEETYGISNDEVRQWSIENLDWFDPDDKNRSEYAQVMENVYHAPGIRRRYLKGIIQNARPSDGYKYLALLLAENVFDTMITTNFDQLVRQVTDPLLPLPLIEVNALEQYSTLTPFPDDEPRIIRMHGDFWHDNVLNTEGELEETPTIRYQAVISLLRSYGLIVMGV